MSTKFLSPGWRMPRNANQSKSTNYSLDFTSSEQINISDLSNIPTGGSSRTISAWFNSSYSSTGEPVIVSYGALANAQMFNIMLKGGSGADAGRLRFVGYNRDHTFTTADLRDEQWHHVAMTYNGTIVEAFLDGSSVGNFTPSTALNTGTSFFNIGVQWTHWKGQISQLCVFDYVLSSSQITTLWGGGTSVSNPMALPRTPIAYYPLGGSAGAFQTPVNNNDKWLIENNAIGDYVFQNTSSPSTIIHSPYNISGLSSVTLSTWIKVEVGDTMTNSFIFSNTRSYGDFELRFYGNDNIQAIIWTTVGGQGAASFSFDYDDGKWHQYVLNYDGSHYKVYVDGVLKLKNSRTGDFNAGIQDLNLFGGSGSVLGKVSNALIHQTTLTDGGISVGDTATGEIATLYNYGSPIQTLANIPQNSNLKAWYKLDASEIYNSSSTEWSVDNNKHPSAYASSLSFNGVSDRVEIPNLPTLFNGNNIFSISCWVKRTTNTGTFVCAWGMGGGGGQALYAIASGDSLRVERGLTSDVYISNFFPLNEWVNLTTVFDSSTNVKIYKNGSFIQDVTVSATPTYASNIKFYIGNGINVGYGLRGNVSNLAIWNSALTSPQVAEIYNNGTPSNLSSHSATSNLVSWFKLSNTTTGIEDSKGSNNGTNNGATEYAGFVNTLVGDSSGMSQSNLVQSDLQTVAPYSKYAMSFDATDYIEVDRTPILNGATSLSISAWCKIDNNVEEPICSLWVSAGNQQYLLRSNTSYGIQFYLRGSWGMQSEGTNQALTPGQWYHIVATWDGSFIYIYVNGSLAITPKAASGTLDTMTGQKDWIGRHSANYLDGDLSNVAYWKNTALNQSQVREIYNEGLPSNLHNFSGTAPTAWWQLGENSSYVGGWTFADEMPAGNNGTGYGLSETDLTNGVGTTANGSSTGMSVGALVGDAPYSTANAISTNMVVTSRVSGVSDAAITTGGTGYVTGTNIATTGGSGTNCTINITTVSGGVITAITINNGGSNYVIGDVLTISGGNGNSTITVSGLNTP